MDGWMDGWRRPNHMRSHMDASQAMPPVNLRRFVGDFHSVAKQASRRFASRSDVGGFSEDFGRFLEAKMDAQIDFQAIFFDVFFERVFASICHRFWEARNLKKYKKPWFFLWFLLIFEKSMFPKKR